jgi:hypothetical protein
VLIFGPTAWAQTIWIFFGFFGTAGIISYAALSGSFPVQLSGRVTTGINLLVFVAAFIAQWAIGVIIEMWPIAPDGSYSVQGYRAGFGLMLVIQVASLCWFFYADRFIKKDEDIQ